jgi:uncharacterized YccA/Bax inhibitor family protein
MMPLSDYKPINEDKFTNVQVSDEPMTLNGMIHKSILLLLILTASAVVGWIIGNPAVTLGGLIIAFILSLVIMFKPHTSPYMAPIFSVFEGLFVGGLSLFMSEALAEKGWRGAVPIAVLGTLIVFMIMFGLYATRIIRVTETFRSVVIGATLAVMVVYIGTFVTSFFYPAITQLAIYQSGPIGIAFSIFVIGLAAFNLALDFDIVEQGVRNRAPKYMEWYAAFGLMVTLVWIYIEILRLMRKLAGR